MDVTSVLTLFAGTAGVIAAGWLFVSREHYRQRREARAIENARWEINEVPLAGTKVQVEIRRVARWGRHRQFEKVIGQPMNIMLVDESDSQGPTMDQAREAAMIKVMTNNSFMRDKRH